MHAIPSGPGNGCRVKIGHLGAFHLIRPYEPIDSHCPEEWEQMRLNGTFLGCASISTGLPDSWHSRAG